MIEIVLWIIGVTIFTILGSWYAKKYDRPDAIIGLYVAFVLFSNFTATKIAEFNLGFYSFFAPAAVIIFSVTFLMTDIVNEKFGRKETHKMVFIAFFAQVAIAFFSWIILTLKPAPFWMNQSFTKGKHLWMRNAFSSLPSMAIDSVLFVTIAFYGLQPIGSLIMGVIVIKWLVGIIDIPFMYLNRWVMYKK